MFRRYRCIILAVAGLALIGTAKAPQPTAKAEQKQAAAAQSKPAPAAALVSAKASKVIKAPKEKEPCGKGRYSSSDDLCAQWKAADAARDAADLAWWQLGLSALGVLGLGLTLWFNFRALQLAEGASNETKDALAIAERNAEAATAQVKIAQDVAERQLRPYLYVNSVVPQILEPSSNRISIPLQNFGKTPAINVQTCVAYKRQKPKQVTHLSMYLSDEHLTRDVPPGHAQTIHCCVDVPDWPSTIDMISSGEIVLVVYIGYQYSGIDGHQYGPFTETIIFDEDGPRQGQPIDYQS